MCAVGSSSLFLARNLVTAPLKMTSFAWTAFFVAIFTIYNLGEFDFIHNGVYKCRKVLVYVCHLLHYCDVARDV